MGGYLTKECPKKVGGNYAGDDITVISQDWETEWIDICADNNSFVQIIVPADVVTPGDIVPEGNIDKYQATIDEDFWHRVILTFVVDPSCIFVNLVGEYNSEALATLMLKLKFYAELLPSCRDYDVPTFFLQENFFCIALFDRCWHRVKVIKVEPDKRKVKVEFIDIGYELSIESSKLRLMKKTFSYLPSQAIRLSLKGIRHKTDKWPSAAKVQILAFVNRALHRQENILCRLHKSRSYQVKKSSRFQAEICAKTALGWVFLNKQLIESGAAIVDDL